MPANSRPKDGVLRTPMSRPSRLEGHCLFNRDGRDEPGHDENRLGPASFQLVMPAHSRPKDGVLRTPMSRASRLEGHCAPDRDGRDKRGHDCVGGHCLFNRDGRDEFTTGPAFGRTRLPGHDGRIRLEGGRRNRVPAQFDRPP
jgi:hypothetical protein